MRSATKMNLYYCKRDKIVLMYDPLLSRCFINMMFTRLVIGCYNNTTEVLQSINYNDMVGLLDEQQQTFSSGITFEYNGED